MSGVKAGLLNFTGRLCLELLVCLSGLIIVVMWSSIRSVVKTHVAAPTDSGKHLSDKPGQHMTCKLLSLG